MREFGHAVALAQHKPEDLDKAFTPRRSSERRESNLFAAERAKIGKEG